MPHFQVEADHYLDTFYDALIDILSTICVAVLKECTTHTKYSNVVNVTTSCSQRAHHFRDVYYVVVNQFCGECHFKGI